MGGRAVARRQEPPPPPRDLMSILDQIDTLLGDLRERLHEDDEAGDDDHQR